MRTLNRVELIGNIGRDPESKAIPSGTVTNFSVATSSRWKDKATGNWADRTEWHNVVTFGRTAEIVRDFTSKGSNVRVVGELRTRDWEKDGVKHYRTEIVANEVMLLGARSSKATPNDDPVAQDNEQPFDDEIPF